MKNNWKSETELATEIIKYLKSKNWTIYPELNNIDIIATKEDLNSKNNLKIIGIECKKHFNLNVLSQADGRRNYVDNIYIAVSNGRKNNEMFGLKIAKMLNIGVFFANKNSYFEDQRVKEYFCPTLETRKYDLIDKLLHPKAENYAEAGQVGGKQWTTFRKTVNELVEYVKLNEGKDLKEILNNIKHHYKTSSSAKNSIKKMIEDKIIKELKIIDGKIYLN